MTFLIDRYVVLFTPLMFQLFCNSSVPGMLSSARLPLSGCSVQSSVSTVTFPHRYEVNSCPRWEGERCAWGPLSFSTFHSPWFRLISLVECPTSHGLSAEVERERDWGSRASPWPSLAGRLRCGCGEPPRGRWRASPRCWDSGEKTEKQVGSKLESGLDNQLRLYSGEEVKRFLV